MLNKQIVHKANLVDFKFLILELISLPIMYLVSSPAAINDWHNLGRTDNWRIIGLKSDAMTALVQLPHLQTLASSVVSFWVSFSSSFLFLFFFIYHIYLFVYLFIFAVGVFLLNCLLASFLVGNFTALQFATEAYRELTQSGINIIKLILLFGLPVTAPFVSKIIIKKYIYYFYILFLSLNGVTKEVRHRLMRYAVNISSI